MIRPKFLHETIKELLDGITYVINFDSFVDNGDDVYTLNGICDFHHVQPGFKVTITPTTPGDLSATYKVIDYNIAAKTLTISGTAAINGTSINLYKPFFFHGTPIQQDVELKKIENMKQKTPMIYLMEPYKSTYDSDARSSIGYSSSFMLGFLTEAFFAQWLTDDAYHKAITPMKNLMEDVLTAMGESGLFYSSEQTSAPTFYTRFGVNIRDAGTKKAYLSENLAGVGVDLTLEIYKQESCSCL